MRQRLMRWQVRIARLAAASIWCAMSRLARPPDSLDTVVSSRQPLGIECKGCGHSALASVEKLGAAPAIKGSGSPVIHLCCVREWQGWLFDSAVEAADFLEGKWIASPVRPGGPAF